MEAEHIHLDDLDVIVAQYGMSRRYDQMQFFQDIGHALLLYVPGREEDAHFLFSFAEAMLPLIEKFIATRLKRDPYTLYVGLRV